MMLRYLIRRLGRGILTIFVSVTLESVLKPSK